MTSIEPIAAVGMAGIFPGAADLDAFWTFVRDRRSAAAAVPPERWIVPPASVVRSAPAPDRAFSARACLLDDFPFDPEGFALDADRLRALDPLYRLTLRTGRKAVSDCRMESVDPKRVAVFLAAIALPTDASSRMTRELFGRAFAERLLGPGSDGMPALSFAHRLSARVTSLPAALLARALGYGGGTLTLDAACASSLYAVKLACDALRSGRADAVLAGGVSRPECLYTQIGFSQLRALSPSGRCAPFDAAADGLVVGEGAGILVLKRLSDALACGDEIHGLVQTVGLSNDMRGNLLSPEVEGQVRAMETAYASAGWTPDQVDLLECHGTGTPVGDGVELQSLHRIREQTPGIPGGTPIGSVKSNVGHLLTAAGAAGLVKTLLALKHRTLPPSANFREAAPDSPLHAGPFRVQTKAAPWEAPRDGRPRRAAVSAFGFGGINAHLLVEEFQGTRPTRAVRPVRPETGDRKREPRLGTPPAPAVLNARFEPAPPPEPVAIVGMDIRVGPLDGLRAFQEALFNGRPAFRRRPESRWRGADDFASRLLGESGGSGAYLDSVAVRPGEFGVPPREIPDILPQQLLMLQAAAGALADAGLSERTPRPRAGVAVGMDFDPEACAFHLRWNLENRVDEWRRRMGAEPADDGWLTALRDACGPPLTAARTLGALGGVVASRVAREFRLGGPSFTVSAEAASGLRALEIAVRSLQTGETDLHIAGAVDLAGDLRHVAATGLRVFGSGDRVRAFDASADGTLPGDGAVALVLKRLSDARMDGDRVYAVVRGLGFASGGGIDPVLPAPDVYARALRTALAEAGFAPETVGLVAAHGTGDSEEDRMEIAALREVLGGEGATPPYRDGEAARVALASAASVSGYVGAASGLISAAAAALCLFQEILPPVPGFVEPAEPLREARAFHLLASPAYWFRNRADGPRRAVAAAMTRDGNCGHVVLEAAEEIDHGAVSEPVARQRRRPLGECPAALFVATGNTLGDLSRKLDDLERRLRATDAAADSLDAAARSWFRRNDPNVSGHGPALALVLRGPERIDRWMAEARRALSEGTPRKIVGPEGLAFFPKSLGPEGEVAFVYPGSGSHYVGMGRGAGVRWPDAVRSLDAETGHLRSQALPELYAPWRRSWSQGWEADAHRRIVSDPVHMLFGQVFHGSLMTRLANRFGIRPDAVIGYSLGETAGYFATGAWTGRGEMLRRMRETDLFQNRLHGRCEAARAAWGIPPDADFRWRVAVFNRPADEVRKAMARYPRTRLLIANTPEECVVGGDAEPVGALARDLGVSPIDLDGVTTVHCDAALPAAEAYRALHLFPTTPPAGVRYYSAAFGEARTPTREGAADSILRQATDGFDFPRIVERAYADGVRIFLEMGPQASCKRMIGRILENRPHTALSACVRGEDDELTILKFLGNLIAERVPVNLEALYGESASPPENAVELRLAEIAPVRVIAGGPAPDPPPPPGIRLPGPANSKKGTEESLRDSGEREPEQIRTVSHDAENAVSAASDSEESFRDLVAEQVAATEATAQAHDRFLDFSDDLTRGFGDAFALQTRLAEAMAENERSGQTRIGQPRGVAPAPPPAFSRDMCMEFAVGAAETVLGPEFAALDTYPARVRLPDEPLMLVDRILTVEGEKGGMGSGRVVTEHDVLENAWYLDGGRAPVCISVEAGQADLFLCSYLGIDLKVKGTRTYRLLDATIRFHRSLPRPGETIRYDIRIDRFIRTGETWMFFFEFDGTIDGAPLITMRKGCAGFFTETEVRNSGGIILTEAERKPAPGNNDAPTLVPMGRESLDDAAVEALRRGDLAAAFGPAFSGVRVPESLRLPGDRMRLIHRVPEMDPTGGRFGVGRVRAEADIHPDDWFLTCHFVDDMVMPGTLMYECCAHALRVLLQRMGWVVDREGPGYEPIPGVRSVLKCRGPVTPETRRVIYEVELKSIAFDPEPRAIADANMYADGRPIVRFVDMGMRLAGTSGAELLEFWRNRNEASRVRLRPDSEDIQGVPETAVSEPESDGIHPETPPPRFTRTQLLAFCEGNPSECFGEPYRVFDRERRIARLPRPPYFFMDKVISAEPEPWTPKPGGWIESEYRVPPDAWYFRADRSGVMPFCILLEIALQPCGFLAAYVGSALRSRQDLKFRNLGGAATLHRNLRPGCGTLAVRCRMTKFSEAGGMMIENFDLIVLENNETIYEGTTYFGFFTEQALAKQVGLTGADAAAYLPDPAETARGRAFALEMAEPTEPENDALVPLRDSEKGRASNPALDPNADFPVPPLSMPAKALLNVDRIDLHVPDGGPHGLGFVRGVKRVDPDEWFFRAHFHQDPVMPGSLGIEAFIQLLRFAALERWPHLAETHRFEILSGEPHSWIYRGQIIRRNREMTVEAVITGVSEGDAPVIRGDGRLLADGLPIYAMGGFGLRLARRERG